MNRLICRVSHRECTTPLFCKPYCCMVESTTEFSYGWYWFWRFVLAFCFFAMATGVAVLLLTGAYIWSMLL